MENWHNQHDSYDWTLCGTFSHCHRKFGIPYFVTAPLDNVRYRPYNLLYVLPPPLDVMLVAADVARRYLWKDVAVLYTVAEGIRHFKYHIYGLFYRNGENLTAFCNPSIESMQLF